MEDLLVALFFNELTKRCLKDLAVSRLFYTFARHHLSKVIIVKFVCERVLRHPLFFMHFPKNPLVD